MLTALAARVAIVETGKADINHNHDTAYAAINHNHDSVYVKKTDIVAQEATANHSETLTYISYVQDTESQGAYYYPSLTFFTSSISNQTATIDINDTVYNQSTNYFIMFINIDEQTYQSTYSKSSGTISNEDLTTDYNINIVWTYENNHLSVSFTIHTDLSTSNNDFTVEMSSDAFGTNTFTYNFTTAIIYKDVLNTNTTEGQVIADIAPKATLTDHTASKVISFTEEFMSIVIGDVQKADDLSYVSFQFYHHDTQTVPPAYMTKGQMTENLETTTYEENGYLRCKVFFNGNYDGGTWDLYLITERSQTAQKIATLVIESKTVKKASSNNDNKLLTQSDLINLIHPIGSIYTSMTFINPENIFPNTQWTQIKDRFLYCADSSGTTGGSETHTHATGNHVLTVNEMPSHSHAQYVSANSGNQAVRRDWGGDQNSSIYEQGCNTGSAGGNQPHNHGDTGSSSNMPPYITVYAWYRTA